MSHVFHRVRAPIVATRADGCWIHDVDGHSYLDAAGGAIVVNVGHGTPRILEALHSAPLGYVHPSVFTSEALESYAEDLAPLVPIDDVRIFPTSGGAESVETALKLARAYHLAAGDSRRDVILSRRQSYHGNTIGALGVSGRPPLRRPYESWLGPPHQVPEVNEYRCPHPAHPSGCAQWHASQLEAAFEDIGPERVAAFIGEAIGGATLAGAVPPKGYWAAIAEVCRSYGALLIVDEIMTGFGRTGHWFAMETTGVRPDIIVSGKGAAGGYWPFGLCLSSAEVRDVVVEAGGFVHGYTFSHSAVGAGVAHAVLNEIRDNHLLARVESRGDLLMGGLRSSLAGIGAVGDVRGQGLLIGIELVQDRDSKEPWPRSADIAAKVGRLARDRGLLVYPSTGCADGVNGDSILLGPPFTISESEVDLVVDRLAKAIGEATR